MRIVIEIDTGAETPSVEVGTAMSEASARPRAGTEVRSGGAAVLSSAAGSPGGAPASAAQLTRAQMVGALDGGAAPVRPPSDGAPPPFISGPPAPILDTGHGETATPTMVGDISAGPAPAAPAVDDAGAVTVIEQRPAEEAPESTTAKKPTRRRRK